MSLEQVVNKASRDGGRSFKTSEAGKAKVRYIAGWCVASLKHHKKPSSMLFNSTVSPKNVKYISFRKIIKIQGILMSGIIHCFMIE
jgi:hypothetical protein